MLLFANSLDGVRGGLVSGFSPPWAAWRGFPVWGGHSHSRRASQFERRTMWGQPPPAVRRSAALLAVQRSCPPLKNSMEDGRPRPPRFEHWRASKLPSRHFKPPRETLIKLSAFHNRSS